MLRSFLFFIPQTTAHEIRHRFLAAHGVAVIVHARRNALDDRPEPRRILRRLRMKHDATDDAPAFLHVVVVIGPVAAALLARTRVRVAVSVMLREKGLSGQAHQHLDPLSNEIAGSDQMIPELMP